MNSFVHKQMGNAFSSRVFSITEFFETIKNGIIKLEKMGTFKKSINNSSRYESYSHGTGSLVLVCKVAIYDSVVFGKLSLSKVHRYFQQ